MTRASRALRVVTLGVLALISGLLVAACESDLSSDVAGKECDSKGACLPGYTCDEETNLCVEEGGTTTPTCEEGQTVCGSRCVVLSENKDHCGGCGTVCTAPQNAAAVCVDSECEFACTGDYLACGDICVDSSSDLANCGECGNRCSMPENGSPTCIDGACGIRCDDPFQDCEGRCLDVS